MQSTAVVVGIQAAAAAAKPSRTHRADEYFRFLLANYTTQTQRNHTLQAH